MDLPCVFWTEQIFIVIFLVVVGVVPTITGFARAVDATRAERSGYRVCIRAEQMARAQEGTGERGAQHSDTLALGD